MAEWSQASRSHVSHMHAGFDFYHGEKSMTLDRARDVKMELITKSGQTIVLKPKVSLLDREVIDSMFMSKKALLEFYEKEIEDARKTGVMFSLTRQGDDDEGVPPHRVWPLRAHLLQVTRFEKHGALFKELGVNVNNGMADLYTKIATCRKASKTRSSATCTRATRTAPSWPWWTLPRASPTSTRPTTSSWTHPCRP